MKPMNELLAEIVTASGGTVTSNTRNGLLQDWLIAVGGAVNWFNASGVIQCGVVINNCDEVIPCL